MIWLLKCSGISDANLWHSSLKSLYFRKKKTDTSPVLDIGLFLLAKYHRFDALWIWKEGKIDALWDTFCYRGFHVTSFYQFYSLFTCHHTPDRHVGFLFTQSGIGKYNKMTRYFLFSSYHNTKLQLSNKNFSTHSVKILILSMK